MPIIDIIGQFVTLEPAGAGSHKGLCPFHEEKTPSFHVHEAEGRFICFGCGLDGNEADFLKLLLTTLSARSDRLVKTYETTEREIQQLIALLQRIADISRQQCIERGHDPSIP